jgi:hypothetical protein
VNQFSGQLVSDDLFSHAANLDQGASVPRLTRLA